MAKTIGEMWNENPIAETDDWHTAQQIVNEAFNAHPHGAVSYVAVWVARLRENFVQIGRELEASEGPPRHCKKCDKPEVCHSQGECGFSGYPLRRKD